MNETYQNELKEKLGHRGLSEIIIDLSYDGHHFGDAIHIKIQGNYYQNKLVQLFKRSKEPLIINYEKTLLIRKISN
ncbi:MAG: hypothetical protein JXR88_05540 [Clostridia bacterium]|nr:hypothetical protein [Clostridia bacterium]